MIDDFSNVDGTALVTKICKFILFLYVSMNNNDTVQVKGIADVCLA